MLFDTHAHLNDSKYDQDRDAVIEDLFTEVSLLVEVGDNIESSVNSFNLAQKYPNIYCTMGIHPNCSEKDDADKIAILEKYFGNEKVVAIGEIGLDYHYEGYDKQTQINSFEIQMETARKYNYPVVIHSREAIADTINVLKKFPDVKGIVHSFSGSIESAREILDLGYYLSFNGVITFKNSHRAKEVVAWMPHDRLLIETDSPYLTPEPNRGKRNTPKYVRYVAEKVAEIWGMDYKYACDITFNNGLKVYSISKEL